MGAKSIFFIIETYFRVIFLDMELLSVGCCTRTAFLISRGKKKIFGILEATKRQVDRRNKRTHIFIILLGPFLKRTAPYRLLLI